MDEPKPGAVVLVADGRDENLRPAAVLANTEEGISIVPISSDVWMATEWDLLLGAELLGYQAMAEVWNYGTVLPEQVREHVGALDPAAMDGLLGLSRASRRGAEVPDSAVVGPPVLDDADPRLLFQDAEGEALQGFWTPALELAGALTLGELVKHRREELGVTADAVADMPSEWLADLEGDRLYLPWALTPSALATLMRQLQLRATSRLGNVVRATLEVVQPALPRGQQSPNPHAIEDPDAYITAFLGELTDPRESDS